MQAVLQRKLKDLPSATTVGKSFNFYEILL